MIAKTKEVRDQILDAADVRFRQFGFGKTTMAEIASDCGMSAANLYRYFGSKADIGTAIAERCITATIDLLREVVRKDGPSAAEKVATFTTALFEYTYEELANEPQMAEMIQFIAAERKELIKEFKFKKMQALMAEVIAEGNRTGEFNEPDVMATAQSVIMATFAFYSPFLIMMGLYSKEEMLGMAQGVSRLLVNGLSCR